MCDWRPWPSLVPLESCQLSARGARAIGLHVLINTDVGTYRQRLNLTLMGTGKGHNIYLLIWQCSLNVGTFILLTVIQARILFLRGGGGGGSWSDGLTGVVDFYFLNKDFSVTTIELQFSVYVFNPFLTAVKGHFPFKNGS